MIIQAFMSLASEFIAGFIANLPPLPDAVSESAGQVAAGGGYLGGLVAKFGIVIPWDVATNILAVWAGLVVFWGALSAVRLVLWAVGR